MKSGVEISFVIPVFRNAGSLVPSYERISQLALKRNFSCEVIFVNDGSDDDSLKELQTLQSQYRNIRIISFSRNFGQVAAITAGFQHAAGDACILMSADLQDPIEKVSEMLDAWQNGSQIALCYRADREDGLVPRLTSYIFYRLIKAAVPKMPPGGFDFLLLGRKALDAYNSLEERNRFFQGDILWLGFTVSFIPYSRQKRTIGKSQWSFSKKLKYFIDGILNTSYIPIRMMSVFGILTALGGFVYAFIILYARLVRKVPFEGWAPLMMLILIIGGLVMLMLGIIGEYLWRSYDESRRRPVYIIDEKFGFDDPEG